MVRCFLIHTVCPVSALGPGESRVLYSRVFGPDEGVLSAQQQELSSEERRLLQEEKLAVVASRLLPHGQLLFLNHRFAQSLEKEVAAYMAKPPAVAYRANRSEDNAVNIVLHFILQHLDTAGTYTWILFVDFSYAFSTIISALLQDKLSQLLMPDLTCRWINNFLSDREQHMKLGKHISDSLTISTSSPPGCVLPPLLFSLLHFQSSVCQTPEVCG
eukprot:superscaffoldBa00002257_g13692